MRQEALADDSAQRLELRIVDRARDGDLFRLSGAPLRDSEKKAEAGRVTLGQGRD